MRAQRLNIENSKLYLLSETQLEKIMGEVKKLKPQILVIDSIQTIFSQELESAPGTVAQVRFCAARLVYLAKKHNISTWVVGHVTKEGSLAGPRVLEHLVDTVLYFDSDAALSFRILRSVKNRFGPTHEIGVFEMHEEGLVEIQNPSEHFLSERTDKQVSGNVVISTLQGTRPILVELQTLVSLSQLGNPRRTAVGVDSTRVSLLLAVLEKTSGVHFSAHDVYVNVAGGVRIQETAADLGVLVSLTSSFKEIPISHNIVFIGEVGLSGEVRAIKSVDIRLNEAKKLGFSQCVVPKKNLKSLNKIKELEIFGVSHIDDALKLFFG